MNIISRFATRHPDLFIPMKADAVHPHDHFIDWLVLRFLPQGVTPNQVTALRVAFTPLVFLLIISEQYLFGTILFVLVAFTDAMDGSLARTRHHITRFGILFDPLADKLLIGSLVLVLVFRYFPVWLGVAILGLEIVFILSALIAKFKFKSIRMANVWGKIKMILQVVAVFVTLLALLLGFPYLFTVAAWLFGLAIGFAIVSLFSHGT